MHSFDVTENSVCRCTSTATFFVDEPCGSTLWTCFPLDNVREQSSIMIEKGHRQPSKYDEAFAALEAEQMTLMEQAQKLGFTDQNGKFVCGIGHDDSPLRETLFWLLEQNEARVRKTGEMEEEEMNALDEEERRTAFRTFCQMYDWRQGEVMLPGEQLLLGSTEGVLKEQMYHALEADFQARNA
jgi:hypothetical protein